MESTDTAVVGAGPIGIEVAWALKREGVAYVHLEAGQVGSTIQWWAPGTVFFSGADRVAICGVPIQSAEQSKPSREEYLAYVRSVVTQFDLKVRTYTRVERAERNSAGFVLYTVPSRHGVGGPGESARVPRPAGSAGGTIERVRAGRLVLAIGDMQRPRRLGIPGEDLPHVSHYFSDPHVFFGRRVLIVGGKNSAVEAAVRCWRSGAHVTLSYRGRTLDQKRVKYWLLPEVQWLIDKKRIGWLPGTVPAEITPGSVRMLRADGSGAADGPVAADFVLLLTGYEQDPSLFEQLGVAFEGPQRAPRLDRSTMETNVPGVYVAGTAVAGTQVGGVKVFIENSHEHAEKIVAAIRGRPAEVTPRKYEELEES